MGQHKASIAQTGASAHPMEDRDGGVEDELPPGS